MKDDIQELINNEESIKDYAYENTIKMLTKLRNIANEVQERIEEAGAKYYSIEQTTGGANGVGHSYLIKARIDYHDFVVAKISDHSKYDHDIQIFDWMDEKQMIEQFDTMKEIIEQES